MIRRGKTDGWLHLPSFALESWSIMNNVQFDGVAVETIPGAEAKGLALLSKSEKLVSERPLITIPRDLVLSREAVQLHAKADLHLREILEAVPDLSLVSSFLIERVLQCLYACRLPVDRSCYSYYYKRRETIQIYQRILGLLMHFQSRTRLLQ